MLNASLGPSKYERLLPSNLTAYASDNSQIGISHRQLKGVGVPRTAYLTVGSETRTLLKF